MAATDLAVRIATIFDSTGLKKADKGFSKLDKSAKSLGRTLGVSLGAAAVVAFGKKAVQAFAEDEKAAVQLNMALKNLGLGFASANVESFIAGLEKSASVADDSLRPAMQALLTTTGSVTQSQQLLTQAIEISRGSGVELTTVAQDLANAYVGNTKGLKKYNLGLTQAELKTMSFTEVQKKLNEQFEGSNAAYLNTTAGKFEAISIQAGNAAEVIGGSLVDSFIALSGQNGVVGFNNLISKLSDKMSGLIKETAKFIWITKFLFSKNAFKGGDFFEKELAAFEKRLANLSLPGYNPEDNAVTGYKISAAAQIQAEKDAKARAKALADATKKNTAELKKQAATKKQAALFDLEKIGLVAALQGKISEEEKLRLNLQLALLTGNDDLAKKLSTELANSIDKTGKLAKDLTTLPDANNPFASWSAYLDMILEKARAIASFGGAGGSSQRDLVGLTPTVSALVTGAVTGGAGSTSAGDVYITVNGSVLSEQDLVSAVQNGLNYNALAGKRSDIGRIAGMFG